MKSNIKYILVGVLLLAFTKGNGQIGAGVEGEISTSSVKIKNIPNSVVQVADGKSITGYAGGLYVKLALGPVYVKPKFLVSYQSGITHVIFPDEHTADVSFVVTKLDIPVLFGLKIIGPLSIEAGPVYNKIIYATKDFNGEKIEIKPNGVGYRVGANAQFGILGVNVAYQGIKNNSSDSFSSYETPDQLIFGISLGF